MKPPTISVVVVSRGRPESLRRCLTGVGQLLYPSFEIVVVADDEGRRAVENLGLAGRVKTVEFDEANISAARNAGLAEAAGEIVAFIDDDAVPEPTWLSYLVQPFVDRAVAASGGYVRGRNGISFQWTAQSVDPAGRTSPLKMDPTRATIFTSKKTRAIKTEGTNCAFRRSVLMDMGGFDTNFHFYMDETDVNLRLAALGYATGIVPMAQVHHGYAASDQRHRSRAPKSLYQIGASLAVFLRKHAGLQQARTAWRDACTDQRKRLLRHMVAGTLEPRDVPRLVADFRAGYEDGNKRPIEPLDALQDLDRPFLQFVREGAKSGSVALMRRGFSQGALGEDAKREVLNGAVVTVLAFSPTALFHSVRFHPDGYWVHKGGQFGRCERSEPIFRVTRFQKRCRSELSRIANLRCLSV